MNYFQMGIYFQTYIYTPELNSYIWIANESIVDEKDIERQVILKEELLKYYSHVISESELTDNSVLIEYYMTSHNISESKNVEHFRFPILSQTAYNNRNKT